MENFKFNVMVIIVFIILGGVIYWSVSSMNNNVYYTREIEDADPITPEIVIETPEEPEVTAVVEEPAEEEPPQISEEHSELVARIQRLIDDRIYMKNGSQGTRVGTVQEFLNIYFDKDARIDNDYGPGTTASVREFQEQEGLDADGQAGPQTYEEMIEWLNNN